MCLPCLISVTRHNKILPFTQSPVKIKDVELVFTHTLVESVGDLNLEVVFDNLWTSWKITRYVKNANRFFTKNRKIMFSLMRMHQFVVLSHPAVLHSIPCQSGHCYISEIFKRHEIAATCLNYLCASKIITKIILLINIVKK